MNGKFISASATPSGFTKEMVVKTFINDFLCLFTKLKN